MTRIRAGLGAAILLVISVIAAVPQDELTRWGTPDQNGRRIGSYMVAFDGRTRCPRWTLERLDAAALAHRAVRDTERFTTDTQVPSEFRPSSIDYARSGFDIGHCVPAADCMTGERDLAETFTFTNACPQRPEFNRGEWKRLETHVREIASGPRRTVWVVTCPLWLPDRGGKDNDFKVETIGPSRVWVPTHCGKAVLISDRDNGFSALAWILPNRKLVKGFDEYRVTTDEFESASGLDLWAGLPDQTEDEIEGTK